MSQSVVLWILGGWFVMAAIASAVIGRMIARNSLADVQETIGTSVVERAGGQMDRPSVAA